MLVMFVYVSTLVSAYMYHNYSWDFKHTLTSILSTFLIKHTPYSYLAMHGCRLDQLQITTRSLN